MSIEQKIAELITKIQDGVTLHGPEAMRLVLLVVRVEAVITLAGCLVALFLVVILGRRLLAWLGKDLDYDEEMLRTLAMIFGGTIGIFTVVWVSLTLFSPRLWMALADPRLALAYDVMKKTLGK